MHRGIDRVTSAAFRPFLRFGCGALGPRSFGTRLRVARWIVNRTFASREQRERVRRNALLIRPDLRQAEILEGEERIFETIAHSWASLIGNGCQDPEKLYFRTDVEGIEHLTRPFREGEKIVVTFDHVGPIDEILWTLPRYRLCAYIPVEPLKPPWLLSIMNDARSRIGEKYIFEPISKGFTRSRMYEHLEKGYIVFLAVDILTSRTQGNVETQLGKATFRFPTGAVRTALEKDAVLIPALLSWGENGKSKIVFLPPFEFSRSGDFRKDVEVNTRRLVEQVYAPHLREHWSSWIRLPWLDLKSPEK